MHHLSRYFLSFGILIFCALSHPILAQPSVDSALESAKSAYAKKDFGPVAHDEFVGSPSEGWSPQLITLRAQANYRAGQEGVAALWYERLLHLIPNQPEAIQNLDLLHRKHGAVGVNHRPNTLYAWLLAHRILLIHISFYASIIALTCFLSSRIKVKSGHWGKLLTGLFFCGLTPLLSVTLRKTDPVNTMVVVFPETSAFAGATTASGRLMSLPVSSIVHKITDRDGWSYVEIRLKDDSPKRAWVKSEQIHPLWPYPSDDAAKVSSTMVMQ